MHSLEVYSYFLPCFYPIIYVLIGVTTGVIQQTLKQLKITYTDDIHLTFKQCVV